MKPMPNKEIKSYDERFTEWRDVHQNFEFDWHSKDNYRWHDEQFLSAWIQNFGGFCELAPDAFDDGDLLLDIGCGSRSALSYFTRGRKAYIDPLGSRFLGINETRKYWSDEDVLNLWNVPAESSIQEFVGKCAFVNCWNVLDHCFDWRSVLSNVIRYVRPGGIVALCTDTKPHGDGHPGIDDPGRMLSLLCQVMTIEKLVVNYGKDVVRDLAMKLRRVS
jgi:SAM-dependent methyltransferase